MLFILLNYVLFYYFISIIILFYLIFLLQLQSQLQHVFCMMKYDRVFQYIVPVFLFNIFSGDIKIIIFIHPVFLPLNLFSYHYTRLTRYIDVWRRNVEFFNFFFCYSFMPWMGVFQKLVSLHCRLYCIILTILIVFFSFLTYSNNQIKHLL